MTRRLPMLPVAIVAAAFGTLFLVAHSNRKPQTAGPTEAIETPAISTADVSTGLSDTGPAKVFGTVVLAAALDEKSQTATKKATPAKATDLAPAVSTATISVDGVNDIDPAKAFGSKSAPVVVEIFSDFQCPACKALFLNTTQKVMDNYVNTGKIYLVHRDFPLPMHAYSRVAASYARAAAHIGKCEAVEMVLFENQDKWEANGDVKGTVASVLTATEMKKVEAIVESKQLEPLIEKDKAIGQTFPVNQTPTTVFHANGQTYPYAGTLSYDVLKDFLDQLVKQK